MCYIMYITNSGNANLGEKIMDCKTRLVDFLEVQIRTLENRKSGWIEETVWNIDGGFSPDHHRAFSKVVETQSLIDSLKFGLDFFKNVR